MKIGICGTGRMGSSIAQRLMSVGHEVGVWNRSLAKTKPLTDAGAKLFASPAELVAGCEIIIVMLLNDAATEAVYREPNGILAMPVLEQLCRRTEHVGALGSGATMKLAVNLPLLVYWQALGEALAICKPLNLPADRLIDILSDTAGTPTAMKGRGAAIAKVLGGSPMGETAFGVSAAKKDLATAVQFGASIHAELPVTESALACFEEAELAGLGDADGTAVSVRWAQRPPRSQSR